MSIGVVDASAVIALILGEPGAEAMEPVIADCAISAINLAEVVGYFARNGATEPAFREMVNALRLETVPFDPELGYATGLLVPLTRRAGLSLAIGPVSLWPGVSA